jgi:hypothetical protein
LDATS